MRAPELLTNPGTDVREGANEPGERVVSCEDTERLLGHRKSLEERLADAKEPVHHAIGYHLNVGRPGECPSMLPRPGQIAELGTDSRCLPACGRAQVWPRGCKGLFDSMVADRDVGGEIEVDTRMIDEGNMEDEPRRAGLLAVVLGHTMVSEGRKPSGQAIKKCGLQFPRGHGGNSSAV